jgi:tetratricopeptide (TPR) repeat protein
MPRYAMGRWDDAGEQADAFLAEIESGRPHYLASQVYSCRALIRLGRGETDGSLADAERALAAGKRAQDKQALLPTLARVAHIRRELGDRAGANLPANEFLSALEAGHVGFALSSAHELSWTLAALGRGGELVAALAGQTDCWARAAVAYAEGDPVRAAEICAESGAVAEEAYARLTAARLSAEQGRHLQADEQLRRALAFYRTVGATRYVREGEALMAASA